MSTPENLTPQTEMLEPFCRTLKELALSFSESANFKTSIVSSYNGIGFGTSIDGDQSLSDHYKELMHINQSYITSSPNMVAYEPELKSSIFISVVFALMVRSVSSDETNLHKENESYQGDEQKLKPF